MLAFLLLLVTAPARGALQVIPDTVVRGGQMQLVGTDLTPDTEYGLSLQGDGFGAFIGLVQSDGRGEFAGVQPVPLDLPVGLYDLELQRIEDVVASTIVTVVAGPVVTLSPTVGVPGQDVWVTVDGLLPGTVRVTVDGLVALGPDVVDGRYEGEVSIPAGQPGAVRIVAENRMGDVVLAEAENLFERLLPALPQPAALHLDRPPAPLKPGETFALTGSLSLPDGAFARDFDWTLAWKTRSGKLYPVNVTEVTFEPRVTPGGSVNFSTLMVAPSMRVGFAAGDYSGVDGLGFVYQNPTTGQGGFLGAAGTNGYDDYDGIVLTGRVDDDVGAPIEGVIWTVKAQTFLADPDSIGKAGRKAVATEVDGRTAIAHGNNQVTANLPTIDFSQAGCPITLYNGETAADGTFQFAFSPKITDMMQAAARAAANASINTPFRGGTFADEFRVRLSGLHLGYGVPKPGSQTYTGIVYDFRRDPDTGFYQYRQGIDGPYNLGFDPARTLVSTLDPIPEGIEAVLPTNPFIPGRAPSVSFTGSDGLEHARLGSLIVYPQPQLRSLLEGELTEIRLPWYPLTWGQLDATLTISGTPYNLATGDGTGCVENGIEYSVMVPGLAVSPTGGPIRGRIQAASTSAGQIQYHKDFEIPVQQGPTWFLDAQRYLGWTLNWDPHRLYIQGTERPTSRDVSQPNSGDLEELEIGALENNNTESGVIHDGFNIGYLSLLGRQSNASVVAANNAGNVGGKLHVFGPTGFDFGSKQSPREALQAAIEADEGEPDFGQFDEQVLFDTGRVPLFRYAWGIPPIAGATLGADFWMRLVLYYFGVAEIQDTGVEVDSIVEPQVEAGLDIFLDLSILFDIVSGTVEASPALGIGMPIVILDSVLDEAASEPCFQFVIDLYFSIRAGICPICVEASHEERILDEKSSDTCSVLRGYLAERKALPPPSPASNAITSNRKGTGFVVRAETDGIHARILYGATPGDEYVIPAGPGAMRPDAAFRGTSSAVAVWSQSSLTPAQFQDRVDADYDFPNTGLFDGVNDHHMVYSTWNGVNWSVVQDLTLPTGTGEGGVRLAACMTDDPACPTGGEILAVWHRDMAGDLAQGELRLYYAFFDGFSWTAPLPVDATSTAKDLQPAPVYVDGEPVVIWVRNPSTEVKDPATPGMGLEQRHLAYRFLRGVAGPQVPDGLPLGVASPSAAPYSNGEIGVTFSASGASAAFLGLRRSLYAATLSNCGFGICDWTSRRMLDEHGRSIFVERPQITVDSADRPVLTYRQLSVSGDLLPSDPVGLQGYGELMSLHFTRADLEADVPHFVRPLTVDGGINWQTDVAFDAALNSIMVVNTKGVTVGKQLRSLSSARTPKGLQTKVITGDTGVTLYAMSQVSDLAVTALAAGEDTLVPGATINVTATVANLGAALDPADPIVVAFSWDGAAGYGPTAAANQPVTLGPGATADIDADIVVPGGLDDESIHRLFVTVNPLSALEESDYGNNARSIAFNELPVPTKLVPWVDLPGSVVILEWDEVDDPRVTDYRVYRRSVRSGEVFAVGFTPTNGFADLNAVPGEVFEYRITAVSETLLESEPTAWLKVALEARVVDLVFADGFEFPD